MVTEKQLVLVLGAHRSGTSLCAAALEALGAEPCLSETYANEENRKGFFEHPDVVDFNDRLLAQLGGSWDNPLFDSRKALEGRDLTLRVEEAAALLREIFAGTQVGLLKDPRFCQLLPFWFAAASRADYGEGAVQLVHTLRDPVEVAISQRNRARSNPDFYEVGRELGEGLTLWMSLTSQALYHSRNERVHYIRYQSLRDAPAEALSGLSKFTGLPLDPTRAEAFASRFVDRSLYRSSADSEAIKEARELLPAAFEFFKEVSRLPGSEGDVEPIENSLAITRDPEVRARMDALLSPALSRLSNRCRRESLSLKTQLEVGEDQENRIAELERNAERTSIEYQQVLEPLRDELDNLQSGNIALKEQLFGQRAEVERVSGIVEQLDKAKSSLESEKFQLESDKLYLEGQIDFLGTRLHEMETSTSWKITRPMRNLTSWLRELRERAAYRWSRFRLYAIMLYHRLSIRQPGLAWVIRRVLRPLFRMMNRLMAGEAAQPANPSTFQDVLEPMHFQQWETSPDYQPLVTVIVPNYNHAPFLSLRLESIFSQTYTNFEVILLDDASSDDSASILREFHNRYADRSKLVINSENSGGVFHQWEKGFSLARGELVWIAESDDWCTENFLETLVPYFENEAIQLAYSRTVFMDGDGQEQIWSINEYLHDIDAERWNHEIVETAAGIVREAFSTRNIVPNVSSAVFRVPTHLDVLNDPHWRTMKTCGDWILYLHLLRGGMLAYSPLACNYYRIHGENTSVDSYLSDQFYAEHEDVALTLLRLYEVPEKSLERLRDNLIVHWRETRGDFTEEAFEQCFSLDRVREAREDRLPNILIASYAFCSGGGETFPITLANTMKRFGYSVTYLDCAREARVSALRDRLRADIPVVSDFGQLVRIVEEFDIDVIHSHHAWVDSTIFELLPPDMTVKLVVTLHGMYETINDFDLRSLLPRLVQRSSALVYVAEKNLDALKEHKLLDSARVVQIDNAVESDGYSPIPRASLGLSEDAFVVTLVSRGMAEKGWQEAIEIIGLSRGETGIDLQLLLVGDGPEYERLSGESLPGYVHLLGFQENVGGYFSLADLGILPSRFRGESFPLTLIECLQAGRPVVASSLGEIPRMLDAGNGYAGVLIPLVDEKVDTDAWSRVVSHLSTDQEALTELSNRVSAVSARFDTSVMASKHDELYRSL